MKKIYILIIAIATFITSYVQNESYKKNKALGVSFILNDFQTAIKLPQGE